MHRFENTKMHTIFHLRLQNICMAKREKKNHRTCAQPNKYCILVWRFLGRQNSLSFCRGEDKLSKETHVSFNAIVKISGRWEDTEDERESSTERGVRAENRNQIQKKREREAASRRAKQGQCRTACETKRWEGGTGAKSELRETMSDRKSRVDWVWKQGRTPALCNEPCNPHFHAHTHTDKELQSFKSSSSTPFLQLIHDKHAVSFFKGAVEAAGIHSDEPNKAHQLWRHEARHGKENQLNAPNEG